MKAIKLKKLIHCTMETTGEGVPMDPIRIVEQIYLPNGKLLIQQDPAKNYTEKDLIECLYNPQKFIDNNSLVLSEHFVSAVERYLFNKTENEN